MTSRLIDKMTRRHPHISGDADYGRFDWQSPDGAHAKVEEELAETAAAIEGPPKSLERA